MHPDAITLFQEWYGIKHISGRQTRSLADIDNQVQNPSLLNCVNEGGLQYLIISIWQVPSSLKCTFKRRWIPLWKNWENWSWCQKCFPLSLPLSSWGHLPLMFIQWSRYLHLLPQQHYHMLIMMKKWQMWVWSLCQYCCLCLNCPSHRCQAPANFVQTLSHRHLDYAHHPFQWHWLTPCPWDCLHFQFLSHPHHCWGCCLKLRSSFLLIILLDDWLHKLIF